MNQTTINAVVGISLIVSLLIILNLVNRDKFMTIKSLHYDMSNSSSPVCTIGSSIITRSPRSVAYLIESLMNAFSQQKKLAHDITCDLCSKGDPVCSTDSAKRWVFANCA